MKYNIKLERNNVTVGEFLNYIKRKCTEKRIDDCINREHFKNSLQFHESKRYIKYAIDNVICQFIFEDNKKGHGYYYQVNIQTNSTAKEKDITASTLSEPNPLYMREYKYNRNQEIRRKYRGGIAYLDLAIEYGLSYSRILVIVNPDYKKRQNEACRRYQCRNHEKTKKYFDQNREKIKASKKVYYEKNKDKLIEQSKAYQKQNCENIKEYQREYYKQNKAKLLEQAKNYQQRNQDKIKAYAKEYRKNKKLRYIKMLLE